MKAADPYDMLFRNYRVALPIGRPLKDVDLVIAYEEDAAAKLAKFAAKRDLSGLMQWLERGRKVLPGDCAPPKKLRRQ